MTTTVPAKDLAQDQRDAAEAGRAEQALSPARLRQVFSAFPTGVTAIAALVDGVPVGLAANSFTAVSLDPPLLTVCMAHTSTTWPLLADLPRLGVSVLGADQEHACAQLASRSADRFADLDWHATDGGAVLLDGATAWFDTSVERLIRAGDHDIVLLRIRAMDADHDVAPLVFHGSRFRRLAGARSDTAERPAPAAPTAPTAPPIAGTEESS
ncbi:flavin reductase family protein [Actinacidiphila paucisporea]|uniref:NADH-FMN oxidoreductase RutF, flavin reductase (DIM6/NTAB) family n=1 Tax=Actinacidiphila paucisporea TaxID=310782 RepID=A0A1M7NNG9_9ACTN|nr:flavin reductase family protein [Actinacidiphila paucisporea]SHN05437.1 NADH-FMN oxidoreductase RutF, flavin reductase (DIM6/NTAB) family [Actinacidiphila paucisporea]